MVWNKPCFRDTSAFIDCKAHDPGTRAWSGDPEVRTAEFTVHTAHGTRHTALHILRCIFVVFTLQRIFRRLQVIILPTPENVHRPAKTYFQLFLATLTDRNACQCISLQSGSNFHSLAFLSVRVARNIWKTVLDGRWCGVCPPVHCTIPTAILFALRFWEYGQKFLECRLCPLCAEMHRSGLEVYIGSLLTTPF